MFRLFQEKYPLISVTWRLYQDIFTSDFNLKFGRARSDTCKYCDQLYNQLVAAETDEARSKIQAQSDLHHAKADSVYESLKADGDIAKVNDKIIVSWRDVQQILSCPTFTHSSVYYKRQLSTYNFGMHNLGTDMATMHLSHECIAESAGEIVSCLRHSYLPCDRDFALIEKQKLVANVMVPFQWKHMVAEACIKRPFIVQEMNQEDFVDTSVIDESLNHDPALKIIQVLWIKFVADDPQAIIVRKSHNVLQP
ncbi:hypothetical protein ANN_28106 [Periplaneta americana]|uniref:Uncharacterized protein n=1 Tax=Periplaneta americana TaxID=6978 RepID=A0ABQ8RUT2_PERAM|nr:hypothetical protein ANN_28106 [Periplaneta americana]